MVMKKIKIGFVGCGDISGIYFKNLTGLFKEIEIAGVCDLVPEKAERAAKQYNVPRIYKDMHELFADDEVDIVLNITRPYEHFDVTMAAIKAGKHVYSEKPLGASLDEGILLIQAAKERGVLVGGAPDTFLGAGIQTCRKLIDDGFIGDVVGTSAFMVCRGHESWHPDPEFYYKYGGGPLLDMGPYYISALVNLIGKVSTVGGMAKATFKKRMITSEPKNGTIIDVEVPTYITGLMQFDCGAIGTIFTTFDAYAAEVPRIEIYGSEGTLSVPDPNTFGGPVRLYRPECGSFTEIPLTFDYPDNSRGLGLADMAKAIQTDREFRANSHLTFHVLEVISGITESSASKKFIKISSGPERPKPMVKYALKGVLD